MLLDEHEASSDECEEGLDGHEGEPHECEMKALLIALLDALLGPEGKPRVFDKT